MSKKETKIWEGRFTKPTDPLMEEFSHSLKFDQRLFEADISVNKAWASALAETGIYSENELRKVYEALDDIHKAFRKGELSFSKNDEDIHSANERWLTERVGELGQKIHTGRSRNDQVMTDVRIYLRKELDELDKKICDLQKAVIHVAEQNVESVMPGYTHLRQAQPISFSHYLLALFFQLQRDKERIRQTQVFCDVLPLGSGAISGCALQINRFKLAKELNFSKISDNSIDATSDRDLLIDVLQCCSQIMLHLSRVSEDFILWSSEAYRFIEIDQAYSTGSSMMPQKRNPDSLELLRGKTARIIGNQVKLLILLKGLPHAYARDLQEDKEPLFDSLDQTKQSIGIFERVLSTITVDTVRMQQALDPALYATDVADYLVNSGLPFREAHRIAGQIVTFMEKEGKAFTDMQVDDFKRFSELFDRDVIELFSPSSSVKKRDIEGGTGANSILNQLKKARYLVKK